MKTNICSFYKDGLIQVHQRGGDVGKTYKQKKLQTCKWELSSSGDGCSTKQRTQSDKLLTWDQICFFVWLMWKTVYLGKSVALHLSCNANSNPSLAASLTPNQNHKPGNFKMIFIHIIQCCKLDTTRLKYTDAQSTKQLAFLEHISPFQFQFLQFEYHSLSFVPKVEGLREKGHLESQGRGVSWHFECILARRSTLQLLNTG